MTALEKAKLAAKALDDKKASDIEIIDVKERTSLSEYFVVASCQSTVQVRACIDAVAQKQGRNVHLKVILETGLLRTPEKIETASFLAMEAGADFIKTSTGKIDVAATPEAAVVMCHAIKDYYAKSGRQVGFKAAGGIRTAEEAALYYTIVKEILGEEWLTPELFRIGASSLANNLLSAIEGEDVKYF